VYSTSKEVHVEMALEGLEPGLGGVIEPDRRLSRTSPTASALVRWPVMTDSGAPCPRPRLKGDTGRAKPHWQAARGTTLPPRPGTMGNAVAAWEFAWRR